MSSILTLPAAPRHLADVAFRFGPAESLPPARDHRREPGATWTLDEVLGALARGAGVFDSRTGLRLRHAHLRPGLAAALNDFPLAVRAWIGLAMTNRPVSPALRSWPPSVRLYVAWLDDVLLPSDLEIQIAPGVRVAHPGVFRSAIQDRLEAGPESAAAPSLVSDLSAVFARYASECHPEAPPARRLPLAA